MLQPVADQIHLMLRSRNSMFRLLLEYVQHVDLGCELDRIDGTICIASVILDQFKDPCPAKTLEGLSFRWFFT